MMFSFPWHHGSKPDLAQQVAAWNSEIAWQHAGICEAYRQADGDIDFFFFGTDKQTGAAVYDAAAQQLHAKGRMGYTGCHDASQDWKYVDSRTVIKHSSI